MTSAITIRALTAIERRALEVLMEHSGSMLETSVPDRNEREVVFGTVMPGHPTFKKLEKLGLVFYTEEDPIDSPGSPLDGFVFTREIYITDQGRSVFSATHESN